MEHRSFLSRLGRVVFILLCTAGVLSGGFLLACAKGWVDPAGLVRREEAQSAAAPTILLNEDEEEPLPRRAVFLPLEHLDQAAAHQAVVVPMKEADGALGYVSALDRAMDTGASSGDPDRNQALRRMNALPGLHTVALVSCLRDGTAGDLALEGPSGAPWRDGKGVTWLDPAQPETRNYLIGVCWELAGLGFDEILLTHCAYPQEGGAAVPEDRGGELEAFCRALQGALADYPVLLSVAGSGDHAAPENASGQTTALLATFARVWAEEGDEAALAAFGPVPLPGS